MPPVSCPLTTGPSLQARNHPPQHPTADEQRILRGESAVRIVSDVVLGMEGELSNETVKDALNMEGSGDKQSHHVHFSETPDEISQFDSLTSENDDKGPQDVENIDKAWYTH